MRLDLESKLPACVLTRLDPTRLQDYACSTGWIPGPRLEDDRLVLYERPETRLSQVRIPQTQDLLDLESVLDLSVRVLARWENRPVLEMLHSLLHHPADILRFVESGPGGRSVSFQHGLDLLGGIRQLLLTAAEELAPGAGSRRARAAQAERFLAACRLDQIEADGFCLNVVCPLEGEGEPLGRRVTERLMRALLGLATVAQEGALTDGEAEPLREGLLRLRPEDDSATLAVSAVWGRSLPSAEPLPERVELNQPAFDRLRATESRSRPASGRRSATRRS